MKESSLFKKVITCMVAGICLSALLLVLGNSGTISWAPPEVVFSLVGILLLLAIAFPLSWQFREKKGKSDSTRIYTFLYSFIRYCIAFNIASFGWKKLFGLQFIVPFEIAARPMNQQSGEWLTWYYYGYSHPFGLLIAFIQILGSYLLLFRKTFLIGALILFPLILNIALVDIFYHLNLGASLQAVVLTLGLLFLLLLQYNQFIEFFLKSPDFPSLTFKNLLTKNFLRLLAIFFSLLFVIYLKYNMK